MTLNVGSVTSVMSSLLNRPLSLPACSTGDGGAAGLVTSSVNVNVTGVPTAALGATAAMASVIRSPNCEGLAGTRALPPAVPPVTWIEKWPAASVVPVPTIRPKPGVLGVSSKMSTVTVEPKAVSWLKPSTNGFLSAVILSTAFEPVSEPVPVMPTSLTGVVGSRPIELWRTIGVSSMANSPRP